MKKMKMIKSNAAMNLKSAVKKVREGLCINCDYEKICSFTYKSPVSTCEEYATGNLNTYKRSYEKSL